MTGGRRYSDRRGEHEQKGDEDPADESDGGSVISDDRNDKTALGPAAAADPAAATDPVAESAEPVVAELADIANAAAPGDGDADSPQVSSQLQRIRSVLRIRDFRWLWITLTLSSFGDWLGLLAKTAMATALVHSYQAANFALGGVLITQLLPSLIFGPLAGAIADRFDRRYTMVACDVVRFGLFLTIPIVGSLTWLFIASFLIECFALFWRPAKEASVPRLLDRKDRLETANQLSLITTYGITPVAAAAVFALLSWITHNLAKQYPSVAGSQIDVAMYINAATFVVAAFTVLRIHRIGGRPQRTDGAAGERPIGMLRLIRDGLAFVGSTPLIRGLVVGILGAFAAGGVIIGTGKIYAASLGGGDAAYGVLFGSIFVGLGLGMAIGPRIARDLPRERLFGVSIVLAGACLLVVALAPFMSVGLSAIVATGFFAGIAYLTGMTLLGGEVEDDMRGRTFAFVQSMVQVVLIGTLALVPFVVGVVKVRHYHLLDMMITVDGSRFLLFGGGLVALGVGLVSYRQMDDRSSVPLMADLVSAVRRDTTERRRLAKGGVFIAFEGGEGAGKSTQIGLLAGWLRGQGLPVTETFEPGGTEFGNRLRRILLHGGGELTSRTEALLFAADRAEHVQTVIEPALRAGGVVLTDRYVDSSLAYQGAGRSLPLGEIRQLQRWATDDLRPDLTVLLDVSPEVGLRRASRRAAADRMEAESADFHRRVRAAFQSLAEASPGRYLVVDAGLPADEIADQVSAAVAALLLRRGERVVGAPEPPATAEPPASDEPAATDESAAEDGSAAASEPPTTDVASRQP